MEEVFMPICIVAIVFSVPILALGIIAWLIVKLTSGGKQERQTRDQESQLIQELYQGLQRMEQRVESLETLLLEREKRSTVDSSR